MDEQEQTLAPPQIPDVPQPRKRRGRPPKQRPVAEGDALAPDLEKYSKGGSKWVKYWIGLMPDCPQHNMSVGGFTFQHRGGCWVDDKREPTGERFEIWDGAVVVMNREKLERLVDRVSRTVVRIERSDPVTDINGDVHEVPPRVTVILIPTEEQIAFRQKEGRPIRQYSYNPDTDTAFCDLAYCVPLHGDRPDRDIPGTIRKTGLQWPGD